MHITKFNVISIKLQTCLFTYVNTHHVSHVEKLMSTDASCCLYE